MKNLHIPAWLAKMCQPSEQRRAWLADLPAAVAEIELRWELQLGAPFDRESGASWVVPATRADGTQAMLKFGLPHMEAEQEIDGLRFWNGDGAVSVLEADTGYNAMLLEYCVPGTPLGAEPEPLQDQVLAGLLRRLWRAPDPPHPFRPLAAMTEHWSQQARATIDRATDRGLVEEGLRLFHELPRNAPEHVLLATDLHAGNVLRAQREPWLVIDPKPFVGDPAYDATQHLYNCKERLFANPDDTIRRVANLLAMDYERVRLWTFARGAVGPWEWVDAEMQDFLRAIAP